MFNAITKSFTAHPASVDESYLEHAWFAGRAGLVILRIYLFGLLSHGARNVHSLLPGFRIAGQFLDGKLSQGFQRKRHGGSIADPCRRAQKIRAHPRLAISP